MDGHLVGREIERDRLAARVAETLSGRGSLVLISGEAGVGKTALAQAVLADSGLAVQEGEGIHDGTPPYGPIISVLRRLRSARGTLSLDDEARPHVALLLPELGPAAPGGDRPRLVEAISSTLAMAASEQPVALLLDDLQWADDATLGVLPALTRSLERDRVLVLALYRSDDIPRAHPVRRMRAELRRAGRLAEVVVEPLDAESTGALLALTLQERPSPALTAAVFERTDGVPFFIEELGSALAASGRITPGRAGLELVAGEDLPLPDSVRDAVLLRASGLPEDARAAVMVAALAGQTFDPELVSAVARLPEWPDELARSGLVTEADGGRLGFRHALIREAFYAELPRTRRFALHRAVAERLEASGAPPVVVAEHWARGREPGRARSCFVQAAREFRHVYAYRDGARAARRALDLWTEGQDQAARLDVLQQLAECAELAGDLGEAIATWREAVEEWQEEGDPRRLGEVRSRLAAALELRGRWEEALVLREAAAAAFGAASRPAEAAAERLAAAAHLRSAAGFRAALTLLETAREEARLAARVDLEARILGLEGNVRARMGEGPGAVELVRSGLALALDHNLTGAAAEIYQRLADSLEHAGDYPAATDTYDAAFGFCEANALEPTAQLCLACLSVVVRQIGDWDRAASLCRQVIASSEATIHARTVATGTLGSIFALRGQGRRARPLLLESASLARKIELVAMELLAEWGLAVLDQTNGRDEQAADRCRAIVERWRDTEERHYAISPLRWATTFFAERGDEAGMRACVAALGRISTEAAQDEAMSALSHALGETALLGGESAQAADHFRQAVQLLGSIGAPIERIESERRAAAALMGDDRREDAVQLLVSAYRTARRLGARPMAQRLSDTLASLGERVDRRLSRRDAMQALSAGLTRRETEVVRLVAVGRTNREIARELFVSPRTVEMHVQNILTKLDCRSRVEAARRAAELGLLRPPDPAPERG